MQSRGMKQDDNNRHSTISTRISLLTLASNSQTDGRKSYINRNSWGDHCKNFPTSSQLLNPLPDDARMYSSGCMIDNRDRKFLQPVLFVTTPLTLHEPITFDPNTAVGSIDMLMSQRNQNEEFERDTGSYCTKYNDYQLLSMPRSFNVPLQLADMHPTHAPFVPHLIVELVNAIEAHCYQTSRWNDIFEKNPTIDRARSISKLTHLFTISDNREAIRKSIVNTSLPVLIDTFRLLLSQFQTKPFHISKSKLQLLVKHPLYDHFLRPNPDLRALVQRTVIPYPRTQLDTLSFIMLHLLHALEYNPDQIYGKIHLCNHYGPLLISFAERTQFYQPHYGGSRSEEAAILNVVLEVCNSHFWRQLTMLKVITVFRQETNKEKRDMVAGMHGNQDEGVDFGDRTVESWTHCSNLVAKPMKIPQTMYDCRAFCDGSGKDNLSEHGSQRQNGTKAPQNSKIITDYGRKRVKGGKLTSILLTPARQNSRGIPERRTQDLLDEIRLYRQGRIARVPSTCLPNYFSKWPQAEQSAFPVD